MLKEVQNLGFCMFLCLSPLFYFILFFFCFVFPLAYHFSRKMGKQVWPSPDVMEKMGAKDALCKVATMNIGFLADKEKPGIGCVCFFDLFFDVLCWFGLFFECCFLGCMTNPILCYIIITVLILGVGSLRFIPRMFPKTRSSQKRHLSAIL